jgi:iron complex outermembrane recepter protein
VHAFKTAGIGSVMSFLALASASPVQAQDPGSNSSDVGALDEVIVTANRREQNLVEVPSAVSAVSGDLLVERGLTQIEDFAGLVPGFAIEDRGRSDLRLVLRGQNTGGAGASVATMIDDVVLSSTSALSNGSTVTPNFDTYDLERVEVLRGPQGTLYGATAQGGLLKYVTRAPRLNEFEGSAELGLESIEKGETGWSVRSMLNAPLGGSAALRFVGQYSDVPGYIDNPLLGLSDADGGKRYGGRVSLLLEPSERLRLRFTAATQQEEFDGEGTVQVAGAPLAANTETAASFRLVGGEPVDNKRIQDGTEGSSSYYNAVIEYSFGATDFISSTSFVQVERALKFDSSNGPAGPGVTLAGAFGGLFGEPILIKFDQSNDHDKFNQEFRLASKAGAGEGSLEWQAGVFFSKEDVLFDQELVTLRAANPTQRATILPFIPGLGGLALGRAITEANYEEISAFGDVTFSLGDRWRLSVGGRYTTIEQDGVSTNRPGLFTGPPSPADPTIASRPTFASDEDKFTFSVAPRYIVSDDVSLYARVASGYRPGGPINVVGAGSGGVPAEFGPDDTLNYELGAKGRLFDQRLAFEFAVYQIDWTDVQVLGAVFPAGAAQPLFLTTNGGDARSRGVEWSLAFKPADSLTVSWNGAFTDAELTSDAPGIGGSAGDDLPYVPKLTSSLAVDYRRALRAGVDLAVGSTWTHVGKRFGEFASFPVLSNNPEIPAYDTVDVRASLQFARIQIDASVRNIGDSRGITSYRNAFGLDGLSGQATIVQPRTYGLRFAVTF